MAAVSVLVMSVYVGIVFGPGSTIWLFVFNILLNMYPVMMQRYNRPRIQKLLHALRMQRPKSRI